jgi:hypothetical protein
VNFRAKALFNALVLQATLVWCAAAVLHVTPGPFRSGKAYVNCVFDGVAESCFLDTGSALTLVTGDFAQYPMLGTFRFKSASGRVAQTEIIQVKSIRLDQQLFNDVRVGRLPSNNDAAESSLGMNILGCAPFTLEFRDSPALRFTSKPPGPLFNNLHVATNGLLSIPLICGIMQTDALVDTGASITAADLAFIRAHPETFQSLHRQMSGIDGTGQNLFVHLYRVKKLQVGTRVFRNVTIVGADLSLLREHIGSNVHAVLGFNILRKTDWFFDPPARTWSVRPE